MDKIHIRDFKEKNVHFVGIGGISMSGLASILAEKGYHLSGSDIKSSELTDKLKKQGVKIYIGQDQKNIKNVDLIIRTAAVKDDNPEMVAAQNNNIPVIDRATLLGQIMEEYHDAIGVSGTHGKTTTTSMIASILEYDKLDPTIHIGGVLDLIGGNVKCGNSSYFVTEACEYVESFLKLHPYVAVILNIDADHLDYYKNMESIYEAFRKYASLVPDDGYCIGCGDDPYVRRLFEKLSCTVISYGFEKSNDWTADDIVFDNSGCASFTAVYKGKKIGSFHLMIPGKHNIYNALASIATSYIFKIPVNVIEKGIGTYKGARRRFEKKGVIDDVTIINDYAHHPTEIKATLAAAKMIPHKNIWCVFQPHTYSRTKKLFDRFVNAFGDSDKLIITDIYAAREKDNGQISSKDLVDAIIKTGKECLYMKNFDDIEKYLVSHWMPGDIVITMGAGDINLVSDHLVANVKNELIG